MEIVTVYEMSNFTQTIPFLIGKASKWLKISIVLKFSDYYLKQLQSAYV